MGFGDVRAAFNVCHSTLGHSGDTVLEPFDTPDRAEAKRVTVCMDSDKTKQYLQEDVHSSGHEFVHGKSASDFFH
jgi:hypothetical protein